MMKVEILPDIDIEVSFEKDKGIARFQIWNKRTKKIRQIKPIPILQAHMILQKLRDTKIKMTEERLKRKFGINL